MVELFQTRLVLSPMLSVYNLINQTVALQINAKIISLQKGCNSNYDGK
jgi:hypothetical protein